MTSQEVTSTAETIQRELILLRRKQVQARTALSRSMIYQ
jgi:hypothetical protein